MVLPLVSIRKLTLEASTPRGTARILRGIDLDIGRRRAPEAESAAPADPSLDIAILMQRVRDLEGQLRGLSAWKLAAGGRWEPLPAEAIRLSDPSPRRSS